MAGVVRSDLLPRQLDLPRPVDPGQGGGGDPQGALRSPGQHRPLGGERAGEKGGGGQGGSHHPVPAGGPVQEDQVSH